MTNYLFSNISSRTIVKQKVKTSTCIEDSTNWDQYCLEKSIAAQLCCKVPEVPHWKTGMM